MNPTHPQRLLAMFTIRTHNKQPMFNVDNCKHYSSVGIKLHDATRRERNKQTGQELFRLYYGSCRKMIMLYRFAIKFIVNTSLLINVTNLNRSFLFFFPLKP